MCSSIIRYIKAYRWIVNGKEHVNFAAYTISCMSAGYLVNDILPPLTLKQCGELCLGIGVGSLLPDIDHKTSTLGKFAPVIPWLHKRLKKFKQYKGMFKHGGITHTVLVNLWIFALAVYKRSCFGVGVSIGYMSHLYSDDVTGNKLPMLWWPIKTKRRR